MECQAVHSREEDFTLPFVPLTCEVQHIKDLIVQNLNHKEQQSQGQCEDCGRRTMWQTSEVVLRFPKYAIVHIQRAIMLQKGERSRQKNNTQLAGVLDPFTIHCAQGETSFNPLAWTQHIGDSSSAGHFVTCVRRNLQTLFCFNDSEVNCMLNSDLKTSETAAILFETGVFNEVLSSNSIAIVRDGTRLNKASTEEKGDPDLGAPVREEARAKELEAIARRTQLVTKIMTKLEPPAPAAQKKGTTCQHFSNEDNVAAFQDDLQSSALSDNVKTLTWNARSIRNLLTKTPVTPFEVEKFDIVVLTETQTNLSRLSKHAKFKTAFAQFDYAFWNTCLYEKQMGYCGVGVLCKARPKSVQWGFTTEEAECQTGRVVVLRWDNVTLVAIYAPSRLEDGTTEVTQFLKKLQILVCQERARCFTFISGDVNIPLTAKDVSPEQPWLKGHAREYLEDRKAFQQLLITCELRDSCASIAGTFSWYPESTRKHQMLNIGMRVDYTLIPLAAQVVCCGMLTNLATSDHRALMVEFNLKQQDVEVDLARVYSSTVAIDMGGVDEEQDAEIAEAMRQTVECLYALESRDFGPQACVTKRFDSTNGVSQPAFHQVTMHSDIVDKAEEDVSKRVEDEKEIEYVQHSLRAYCNLQELRKLRSELPPPRVRICFEGALTIHYGLVDTGATLCLCDAQLARKHVPDYEKLIVLLKSFRMCLGDGETTMTVVGKMQVTFVLEDEGGVRFDVTQMFYITKGLPDCWVLGDSLFKDQRQHRADISQYYRHLLIKGRVVPYVEMQPHFHVFLKDRETLPASSSVKCFVTNAERKEFSAMGAVFDRIEAKGVHILPQDVFTWAKGGMWISIINKTKKTITLRQGQSVACFQSTSDLCDGKENFSALQQESEYPDLFTGRVGKENLGSAPSLCSSASGSNHTCGLNAETSSSVCANKRTCGLNNGTSSPEDGNCIGETSVRKLYDYDYFLHETLDVEGDKERTLRERSKPNVPIAQAAVCVEDMECLSGEQHLPFFDGDDGTCRRHTYRSCWKSGRADSEFVKLLTPQSGRSCQCIVQNSTGPVRRSKFTTLSRPQVSLGRHSQDAVADTAPDRSYFGVSSESEVFSTSDLGVAEQSARTLESSYLEFSNVLDAEFSKNIVEEILTLPHVKECEIPDYFAGHMLDDGKLPEFLKGWGVQLDDLAVTKEEFNIFHL
jgi:exodeoxyribonuclease III